MNNSKPTFSEISRRTGLNSTPVSRSHVSRVCRGRVHASQRVGKAIAEALDMDYYTWLKSVWENRDRFEQFIWRSQWPRKYSLREYGDLLDKNLRVVLSPNGGFEIVCDKGYMYGDIHAYDKESAQEKLADYLAVLQQERL